MKVGLARVSSVGQNLDSQIVALKEYGCEKIFTEKKSGTKTKGREALREWIEFMREGDCGVVTRLDRCSRSVLDLQLIVRELEDKGVTFAATEQSINTRPPEGKCFLNMLSVFSEFETSIRKERQMDGIRVNKHKFRGRGQTIDVNRVKTLKDEGLGATAIAKKMNIDRTYVYRLLKQKKIGLVETTVSSVAKWEQYGTYYCEKVSFEFNITDLRAQRINYKKRLLEVKERYPRLGGALVDKYLENYCN